MNRTQPTTILCLVSEQRMQNLLPLFHTGFCFNRVVLLASRQEDQIHPHYAQIAEDMQIALRDRVQWVLWPDAVNPMIPGETEQECRRIIAAYDGPQQVMVNFTGGTKPMSIGAFNAGTEGGATRLYIDTQAEQFYIYEGAALHTEAFSLETIPVSLILSAHGKPVNELKTSRKQPLPFEWALSKIIFDTRGAETFAQLVNAQTALRRKKEPPDQDVDKFIDITATPEAEWLFHQIIKAGQAEIRDGRYWFTSFGARFLDGNWLEQYVVLALQHSGYFPPEALAWNLMVSGIENEIDIACTLNGKLGIIECKTGNIKGTDGIDFLNRLRALKDSLAGTFGKTFLVMNHSRAELSQSFQARAGEYVSRIICIEDLENITSIIYQEMTSRSR